MGGCRITLRALVQLSALAATLSSTSAQVANEAPSSPSNFSVRDLSPSPPKRVRIYHTDQLILKAREGYDRTAILNNVISDNKESFQSQATGSSAEIIETLADGAVVLNVGSLLIQKESQFQSGVFAVESAAAKESAEPGSLDDLINRIAEEPGVEYVEKNYVLFPQQVDNLNAILGGGESEPAKLPRKVGEPTAGQASPAHRERLREVHPNDPELAFEWYLKAYGPEHTSAISPGGVDFPAAWSVQTGNAEVIVAVIDTGLLLTHEDFFDSRSLLPGIDLVSSEFQANDGDGRDDDPFDPGDANGEGECYEGSPASESSWHGSHVAGIIGGLSTNNGIGTAGGAWNVKLLPIRVLGKCGGSLADIIDGIRWAAGVPVEGLPDNPTPATVINMSLGGGGGCSVGMQDAINDAVSRGTTVVVAAGNEADDASNYTPAGCDNIITVAASDARGYLVERYSNYGRNVTILAPGGDVQRDDDGDGLADGVLSTVKDGYAAYNGTSMAAPVVAAAVALLKSVEPHLAPAEVAERLKSTARHRSSVECPQPCGAGMLNVGQLILCSPQDAPTPFCNTGTSAISAQRP